MSNPWDNFTPEEKEELHALHMELWNWLAENADQNPLKWDWPGWQCGLGKKWERINIHVDRYSCAACAIRDCLSHADVDRCGSVCPVDWEVEDPDMPCPCQYEDAEDSDERTWYVRWSDAWSVAEKWETAITIADAWDEERTK